MSNESKKNNLLNFFIRLALSIGILWFIFSKIDTQKTIEVVKSADIKYLVLALLVFIGINVIILIRWITFIKALDLKVPGLSIIRYFLAGLFGNLFLPSAIGGDIIKIAGLCRNNPEKAKVVASVMLDRLSGFVAIVIVGTISFIFGYKLINDNSLAISIAALAGFSLMVGIFLFNERIYSIGISVFSLFPKIKEAFMKLHYDIVLLKKRPKEGLKAIFLSCLCQITLAYSFYLIAKALHQDVNLIYFFVFIPLVCVASSLPSIGGLGVREAGAAYLFAKAGVIQEVSVSMSLLNFLFMVIVGLFGGIFYASTKAPK